MTRTRSLLARVLLAAVALVVAFVLGVGLIDLFTGQSYIHRLIFGHGIGGTVRMAATDEERVAAAAKNPGAFSAATDPRVGITMLRGAERKVVDAVATMDIYGQRKRVGPPAQPGAQRIVVLGDSVAFGYGVADDQTIGHYLEDYLARTVAPGTPRPIVETIACPGWNHRNATRYMLNHMARLDPDVVVFVPIGNDLHDGYTVLETGHRSLDYDATRGAGEPHTSAEQWNLLMLTHYKNAAVKDWIRIRTAGGINETVPHAVTSDLTRESRRRWDTVIAQTRNLDIRLAARGAKLVLAFTVYEAYMNILHVRVAQALPDLPLIYSFEKLGAEDRLSNDPHPNPNYTKAAAWCIAEGLVKRGLVRGATEQSLPAIEPTYADRRMQPRTLAQAKESMQARKKKWADFFGSEIVLRDTTGFHQVYGAVHGDGAVNRVLWLALKNSGGRRVEIEIDRLAQDSCVYPLELIAEVNGKPAGKVGIPPPEEGQDAGFVVRFDIPRECFDDPYLDVRIEASNWIVAKAEGLSRIEAFRFVRLKMID